MFAGFFKIINVKDWDLGRKHSCFALALPGILCAGNNRSSIPILYSYSLTKVMVENNPGGEITLEAATGMWDHHLEEL